MLGPIIGPSMAAKLHMFLRSLVSLGCQASNMTGYQLLEFALSSLVFANVGPRLVANEKPVETPISKIKR